METLMQTTAAIYKALLEAAGPQAARVANRVVLDAIRDGAVDDPAAISVLRALADDAAPLPDFRWLDKIGAVA